MTVPQQRTNTKALLAFALSIAGFAFFPLSVVAIVCTRIARREIEETSEGGNIFARIATILGGVNVLLVMLVLLLFVFNWVSLSLS